MENKNQKKPVGKAVLQRMVTLLPIVISVFSLFVSVAAYKTQADSAFHEKVFQPVTYRYAFEIEDQDVRQYQGYEVPSVQCTLHVDTGFVTQVALLNCDGHLETLHRYSTKSGTKPENELQISFPLPFETLIVDESAVYQYLFVYVEGADGTGQVDCLVFSSDGETGESETILYEKTDLLRLEFEQNEAQRKILQEYAYVCQALAKLP